MSIRQSIHRSVCTDSGGGGGGGVSRDNSHGHPHGKLRNVICFHGGFFSEIRKIQISICHVNKRSERLI